MAKTTVTTTEYTDDIDGSNAAGTITFGFDGANYEIDLSKANARAFEKAIKPYVDAGRKVRASRGKASTKAAGRSRVNAKHDLPSIRSWAKTNGYDVSDRGRVSAAVLEAFHAAH
jgi:hypothetical protein